MTAIAFSGCAGIGMPYNKPVRICMLPKRVNTLAGFKPTAKIMPAMRGKSVPISPKAPENSLRSKRTRLLGPALGGELELMCSGETFSPWVSLNCGDQSTGPYNTYFEMEKTC